MQAEPEYFKPYQLKKGDVIGVFTPSSPGYQWNEELFMRGVNYLEELGFKIKLGKVTAQRLSQGYRSASPQTRAEEFMELISDSEVHGLMSTIGGNNSSSMIPFLDFKAIRQRRKPICGFSDITSLHAAILKHARLRTFYGPSVMCWFGDWPQASPESTAWFLDAVQQHRSGERPVYAPDKWSNHKRNWVNGEWCTKPREWQVNDGWKILSEGVVEAEILAFNLNTILSAAGTRYWPDFKGKILIVEDMDAPQSRTERSLQQLSLIGVFDEIVGLIVSKPEEYDQQRAPFTYDDLINEVVGSRPYPIVTNFDCGHTIPIITIPQLSFVRLTARAGRGVDFVFLDGAFCCS